MRTNLVRAIVAVASPGLAAAWLLVVPVPAHAATGAAVGFTMPNSVIEGRTHLSASLQITNASTGPQAVGNATVNQIYVWPSCGGGGSGSCTTPDTGVFRFSNLAGVVGTACEGRTFTTVSIDATGKYRLDPSSPITLGPPSLANDLDICTISFDISVLKMPVVDVAPATPGVQTLTLGQVNLTHQDLTTGNATASKTTTVQPTGGLRVITSPPVPSQISINGVPADTWGVWTQLPVGSYTVSFGRVEGWTEPAPQNVTVTQGSLLTVTGTFTQRGSLRVQTNPAVPGTISVDGVPRNDFGMWTDLPTGTHQVCFGAVADYIAPGCQDVTLTAGQLTSVTGTYTASPGAPGPAAGYGFLKLVTSPPVPAQISANGVPLDSWGVWVKVPAGNYNLSFGHVEGWSEPASVNVQVTAGGTKTVTGTFAARGVLRVITNPALPSTITVNDVVRNDYGMWTDLPAGNQHVCFGAVSGYSSPNCVDINVPGGVMGTVTGNFTPFP